MLQALSSGKGTIELIVVCIYFGILAACAVAIYQRRVLGEYIRALIRAEAFNPASAKSLSDLGFEKKFAVVRALRGRGAFVGLVFEASEQVEFDREDHALPVFRERFDVRSARFYIPEPLRYRADLRFEKKGSHIMALVIGAILFAAVGVLLVLFKDRIADEIREWFNIQ